MSKTFRLVLITLIIAISINSISEAGIGKVARRLNVIEFFGGYARPVGTYDGIDVIDFRNTKGFLVNLDADKVYDPSFYLGFTYGQLRNKHVLYSLGFRYTKIETLDTFEVEPGFGYVFTPETPKFNQYDIDFNLLYYVSNPMLSSISPYFGLGFHGGITSVTGDKINLESNNNVTLALGLNFGADLKIWKSLSKRSFVTLSSVNEYQFLASNNRPKYLNIGVGLKYYFRP